MGSGRGDRNQDRILQMSASVENASMGSGRGDRNQPSHVVDQFVGPLASMGSGRGDRNQPDRWVPVATVLPLQWGPVVVTGIRGLNHWGGWQVEALQWGPVVVTGISRRCVPGLTGLAMGFNGVRSW